MPEPEMRERIKQIATEMLTRHGYRGLRFQQISDQLNITRATVHYYFGNKRSITEEVVADYAENLITLLSEIWSDRDLTLGEKINQTMLSNRKRYLKFNPTAKTANAWSLIARMRLERDVLSDKSKASLDDFSARLEAVITEGVRMSVARGELRADVPIHQLAIQLFTLCSSSDPITQDSGSFERLAQLYSGFFDIIEHAYGMRDRPKAGGNARPPIAYATRTAESGKTQQDA